MSAHQRALTVGGLPGINDLGLIESAIARPYSGYHRPIAEKASALVESVARNHAFVDGNKRTALILVYLLIHRSGYRLNPSKPGQLEREAEKMIMDTVLRRLDFQRRTDWFKDRLSKR